MSINLTYPTLLAESFFTQIDQAAGTMMPFAESARPGDIVGFVFEMKFASGKNGYYTGYPIDSFLVLDADRNITVRHFRKIAPADQPRAALLAMYLNIAMLSQDADTREALDAIEGSDGDTYATAYVLRHLALVSQDHFAENIEINLDDQDYTQDEIDSVFRVLSRKHPSQHAKIAAHKTEEIELAWLNALLPIRDAWDADNPAIFMTLNDSAD